MRCLFKRTKTSGLLLKAQSIIAVIVEKEQGKVRNMKASNKISIIFYISLLPFAHSTVPSNDEVY